MTESVGDPDYRVTVNRECLYREMDNVPIATKVTEEMASVDVREVSVLPSTHWRDIQ